MKLERKRILIFFVLGTFIILTVGVIFLGSNILYKEENLEMLSKNNSELAYTINGEKRNEAFPSKTSGYEVSSVTCKNGVTASWNQEKWGLSNIESNGNQKVQCNIDFSKTLLVNYLKKLNSNELIEDETTDHNLRYIGKNPNNYVSFNGELWRIIGVMNDVADESGVVEPRVKLIRSESIGLYAYDNTGEQGTNDWSDSALMKVLNSGAYYNRTSGDCPSGQNGATTPCDFSNSGLTSEAKNLIGKVKWKLGGTAAYDSYTTGLASHFYGYERGTTVISGHKTEWLGNVGLIYPSDYGYATSGGATTNRSSCLNIAMTSWMIDSYSDCQNNNWFGVLQWSITPHASVSAVYSIFPGGYLSGYAPYVKPNVWPVVYLNTSVKIESGTGTSGDPFILEA